MKRKILIVDDEQIIVEVIQLALGTDSNFEMIGAENGETALRLAKERQPDLVLMDVDMPKMDGIEACRALKSNATTSGIPVIMLSAMAQQRDVQRGLAAGADSYITKPFSPSSLLKQVNEMLNSLYAIGQSVCLKDGRVGTIRQRVQMEMKERREVGYHVVLDTGAVATVPVSEIKPL